MTHTTLLAAAALLTPAAAPPAHAAAAAPTTTADAAAATSSACAGMRPSHLRLSRKLGHSVGVLRWRTPAGMAVRVLRDGHVVGQTTSHALRLSVRIGHVHRFAVVPLTASGRPTRCTTTRRVRVRYHAPGTPRDLTVVGDERGLRLRWRAGRRGDGRLAGYRLLRNGATIGQTRHRSWRLGASPNRTYRFAVVAVDRGGHTSRPSKTVTAATLHAAPSPPSHVRALPVSDSALGVQWSPSRVGAGRITGYRVLRDGVVVKQVAGTSLVLDHLAASTAYRITVVAIDSLGYTSAPSAPVDVRTQDPVPTSGHAQAYLLATTDQSFADFRAHYQQIGVVYPTYFDCTAAADLGGRDDPLVTRWAEARRVHVLPRINCQHGAVVHEILTDPATRARWLDALTGLVAANGYDGVSLDFEAGPASDRGALSAFVEELGGRLHAAGKLLTVAVSPKTHDSLTHPRSGIFDYARLSQAADWVFVMAWGLHWATSSPGAQDDATWAQQVAAYVATMPLKQKFVYGTNLYAMDWPAGGGASHEGTAYEHDDIVPRLPALGATIQLDAASDSYHATYTDGAGVGHDVWYPDAGTTGRRIRLAAQQGLGGVGFWRLGREDQRTWADPLLAPGAVW